MTDSLNLALQLLIVGMLSVFIILAIVVGLGRLLIYLVNRFGVSQTVHQVTVKDTNAISSKKIAVLSSVVDVITDHKGTIKSISKL